MPETSSKRTVVEALIAVVVVALVASAATTWVKLGTRTVNFAADHDTIRVSGEKGRFHAIRLNVAKRGVHFTDLKIFFGDGAVQEVSLRTAIPAGGHTRVIDLKGGARVIRKVEFVYRSAGAPPPRPRRPRRVVAARAKVELWARR